MKTAYTMQSTHKHMRGFEYLVYSAFSLCLVSVLALLPLAPLFANEETPTPTSSESDVSAGDTDSETDVSNEPSATQDELPVAASESEDVPPSEEESDVQPDNTTDVSTDATDETGTSGETPLPETGDDVSGVSTDETPPATTSPPDEQLPPANEVGDVEVELPVEEDPIVADIETTETTTTEPEDIVEEVSDSASSTEELTTYVNEVTNDENRFSFSKDECTLVGDGTFYCAKAEEVQDEMVHADRVYADFDADGDKEIFIEKDGERVQLTSNTEDDDAPAFDELSETIVWHRLIDGRYQIISYSLEDEEETQFTFDRFNNMQPNRYGDVMVWQGWVGNDWEIFKLDGNEVKMLTDNTSHDIAPHINGDHVIWQSFENDAWVMKVYDIRTGEIQTVEGAEGGSIENPRFVLVYDTKYDSGDVETRGFDLESGEMLRLGAEPAKVPEKLPDPEQTGEERALVTPTPQLKSKTIDDTDDVEGDEPDLPEIDEADLVIPPFDAIQSTSTESGLEIEDDTQLTPDYTIYPELIPTLDLSTSTPSVDVALSEIEDVIVTPFVEPIETLDPQEEIVITP